MLKLYTQLLKLYPKPYRQLYEQQMLQTTADMLDAAVTPLEKTVVWIRLATDLPVAITRQQLHYAGGIMYETPKYIKRNSLIASILLLPFCAALTANALDKAINNHTLYNSWLWHASILSISFIWLPELAFLLLLGSYVVFVADRKGSWTKRVRDIRHTWPIIIPGVVAFGILMLILFHDSAQCVLHSPAQAFAHPGQTWQCIAPSSKLLHRMFL